MTRIAAGRAWVIAVLFAALVVPSAAHANPADAFGLGSRAPAMGGAATALCDDSTCNYYNPAGLVRGRELRLDLGYHYAQPSLTLDGRDGGLAASRGFQGGLVAPAAWGRFRFAFGLTVAIPDQRLYQIRSVSYEQARFPYYDTRIQRVLLAANLAIQIVPGLYIGGGLAFLSNTSGSANLKGIVAYTRPEDSELVSKVDVGLFAVRYPHAGILWEATRWLSLGLSYRHSFTLKLDQTFRIDGDVGNPGLTPIVKDGYFVTHTITSDLFQPWQLTAGFAARVRRNFTIAFDATFARWSEYPTYQPVDIQIDIGVLNSKVKLTPPRTFPPSGFHDILIPRLGFEARAVEREGWALDFRGGYSYERSPVPEQVGESNLADSDKHTFSAGAGIELRRLGRVLRGSLSIDAHFAATYLPTRDNLKLDPLDRAGDFTVAGVVWQAGTMVRCRF